MLALWRNKKMVAESLPLVPISSMDTVARDMEMLMLVEKALRDLSSQNVSSDLMQNYFLDIRKLLIHGTN